MACEREQLFSITVFPFAILCDAPPIGIIGTFYDHVFPVMGGVPPYSFEITAGSLPPGLILNTTTGEVSGTPTVRGVFPFTIQVTDSQDTPAVASVDCSITIQKRCLLVEIG